MKFRFKSCLFLLSSCLFLGTLVSCGQNSINTPEDAIKDAFGDKQFRISFDSTNLDTPISDIFYSANNMPKLPTPTKVGYTFEGWFFDQNYKDICDVDDGSLFWKMKNVTLYAKWKAEEIVNNGQYDIEYEAIFDDSTLRTGPLAKELGFYKFNEDIIESGTYIEKNSRGTFLRVQYDCRTRGPVLGGEGADSNNFSKLTYTITVDEPSRLDASLSILDRTSQIQTLYYNIDGLLLSDPIRFHIEYYNWKDNLSEKMRKQASAFYDVVFNITRFIGFGASFIDTNARLEDGIYTIPTHYTSLNKTTSILDAFNPVTSYIVASKGNYKLYKPMNAYNSDIPTITQNEFPLRSTGFAKEFTYFLTDNKLTASPEEEANPKGEYFIPEIFNAEHFETLNIEFNGKTGEYYYILDLGNTLTKDIIFLGGSCGAMEQMFSFAADYRRLVLDYDSMIRVSDWDYNQLTGSYYSFKKQVVMYPGHQQDFENSNTDFDLYQKFKNSIDYTNVFYTEKDGVLKVYDSKITIKPTNDYPLIRDSRYSYQYFDMTMQVYGYDPKVDGELLSRDYVFTTAGNRYSNSEIHKNINGKTLNIGDSVNLNALYREKVSEEKEQYEYKAYKLNNDLSVNYNKSVEIEPEFQFSENIAIEFSCDIKGFKRTSLVKLVKHEKATTVLPRTFKINTEGIYESEDRFKISQEIVAPEVQYSYYNEGSTSRSLHKDDYNISNYLTDFTHVTFWYFKDGVYKHHHYFPANEGLVDFIMDTDKVRILYQLENQFNEVEPLIIELKGIDSGYYEIKDGEELIQKGDLFYDGNKRLPIRYEANNCYQIANEADANSLSPKLDLFVTDNEITKKAELTLEFGLIYLKSKTAKVLSINEIWNVIKEEPYAIAYLFYNTKDGDQAVIKAQYNFKIDGKNVNNYNIIDLKQTYFTNQEVKLEVPEITTNDFLKVSKGYLQCFKKVGNHYVINTDSISTVYDKITFHENGTYLISWTFMFTVDKYGNKVFDTYDSNDYSTRLEFNIAEEVTIVSPDTNLKLTYVTDLEHPFNPESHELKGFEIVTKGDYQYASKTISSEDHTYCLSREAYMPTYDKLYRYDDGKGNIIGLQYKRVDNLHLKLHTLNPILYACWDKGINVDVYYDVYGEKTFSHSTNLLFKDINRGYDEYTLYLSDTYFERPEGYTLYGWKADDQIFYEQVVTNGKVESVKSNFHKGELPPELTIRDKITLTAIFKEKTVVNYSAYDVNGNKLKFIKNIDSDYNVFIEDYLFNSINKQKFSDLKDIYVTDTSKDLLYWEVYNYDTKQYERVDLDSFMFHKYYENMNGEIELRAIFG